PLPASLSGAGGRVAVLLAENRAQQSQKPKDVELKIQEARYLSWLARHYTAANRYRAILRDHPKHAEALTGYGRSLFWQSNWRESETVLTHAIALSKAEDLTPRIAYLRVIAEQGRASEAYRQAMDLDRATGHQDPMLGILIADMLGNIGMHTDGMGYASRSTEDADLQIRQTGFHAKQSVNQQGKSFAPQAANHIVSTHPDLYNAYITAGDLLAETRHDLEAINHYERAARMSPEREEAYLGHARVVRTRARHAQALDLFQTVVQANPESINGWIGVAEMSRFQGQHQRAWQALETAHSVAPGSADVFREKLKLALAQKDEALFQSTLDQYRSVQPNDPFTALWINKWSFAQGNGVNEDQLRSILDPMAPELNTQALSLLRDAQNVSVVEATAAVPRAPTPTLDVAARHEVRRRMRSEAPRSLNVTTGYEYSSLKPTTVLGGNFPDWHEAFIAGFYRNERGQTFTFDQRHYERFDDNAHQIEAGALFPVSNRWLLGGRGGGGLFGDFIPRWRAAFEAVFLQNDRWTWRAEHRYLRFADNPVYQAIPSVTWKWNQKFSSTVRLYVTHSNPNGARSDTGFSGYFDLAYRVAANSHAKIHYARGDENAGALIRGLIGEKDFQSVGIELRLGLNNRWALIPGYRFERHNLFDLHAVALALNGRF
ncbi:MAG: YaiO family outer membrane beta-barrel protein, partial [Limisphaerales bacterium]